MRMRKKNEEDKFYEENRNEESEILKNFMWIKPADEEMEIYYCMTVSCCEIKWIFL